MIMTALLRGLFRTKRTTKKKTQQAEFGIVLISKDPEKDAEKYRQHMAAIKQYPEVVKSYNISEEEARRLVPDIKLPELPAYALIREGIYSAESFEHRLEHALIITNKSTEVLLFLEYMKS